jgi:hypothetical protein
LALAELFKIGNSKNYEDYFDIKKSENIGKPRCSGNRV